MSVYVGSGVFENAGEIGRPHFPISHVVYNCSFIVYVWERDQRSTACVMSACVKSCYVLVLCSVCHLPLKKTAGRHAVETFGL